MATIDDFGGTGQALNSPKLGGPDGWAAAVRDKLREIEDGMPALAFDAESLPVGSEPTVDQVTADGVTTVTLGIPEGSGPTGPTGATGDVNNAQLLRSQASILNEAVVWYDAAALTDGDALTDISGHGRDAAFGAGAAAPTVLEHTGTDYVSIPSESGNNLSIAMADGAEWTATKLDGTTVSGTHTSGTFTFSAAGSWTWLATDDGTVVLDPSKVAEDHLTIPNAGSAGGSWTITRPATSVAKVAVVTRPALRFDGAQKAQVTLSGYGPTDVSVVAAIRSFGYSSTRTLMDIGDYSDTPSRGFYVQRGSASIYLLRLYSADPLLWDQANAAVDDGTMSLGWTVAASRIYALPGGATDTSPAAGRVAVWQPGDKLTIGVLHNSSLPSAFELLGLAIFDRTLTDAELAQAMTELSTGSTVGQIAADLDAHIADTTGVHGIADTADLVTVATLGTAIDDAVAGLTYGQRIDTMDARDTTPTWASDRDLVTLAGSGLTLSSGTLAASSGGTLGSWSAPIWGGNSCRMAARIVVTKATSGSQTYLTAVGGTPGTHPSNTAYSFGGGYIQGVGICMNKVGFGSPQVLVADASLTDGDIYDVVVTFDQDMILRSPTSTGGIVTVSARKVGAETILSTSASWTIGATYSPANMCVRTNVASAVLSRVVLSAEVSGNMAPNDVRTIAQLRYTSRVATEDGTFFIPAQPNGRAVIMSHGHGDISMGTNVKVVPTMEALAQAGYTVVVPYQDGNLWGNDHTMDLLADLHTALVDEWDCDPKVHLWGDSMGGGASLTAVGKGVIPVRSMYLAEPVCSLVALWSNPSFTTLPAAYSNNTALRDANDPLQIAAANYANVPMLFVASASDTTISKTTHTDAMRTHLGSNTAHYLLAATGNHVDQSHYNAAAALSFFRSHP